MLKRIVWQTGVMLFTAVASSKLPVNVKKMGSLEGGLGSFQRDRRQVFEDPIGYSFLV
jgi:hypothetical protein